ncbi:MAG: hypothetical protein GPJ51_08020 [Candidatus Heimdallarchaeota archaeon]|nr:hypothetical protein [Candidatus Heimdallarchaeota archaeon]
MYSVVCGFRKKMMILVSICLILSIIISVNGEEINFSSLLTNHQDSYQLSSLAPHSAIIIENDDNFTDYGFDGNGSESNPYIIENYNITATGLSGIYVGFTEKYFEIRNCLIDSSSLGIRFEYVTSGTGAIYNNTFVIGHADGIQILNSNNVTISNNTCIGRFLDEGDNGGIVIARSQYCLIENNSAYNKGIRLIDSFHCIVRNNSLYNCGLSFLRPTYAQCFSHTIENNTVNGKQLGYFIDQNSIHIQNSSFGQIVLVNCDNSIIENQNISKTFNGISLFYTGNSFIGNNTCNNNIGDGIYLFESSVNIVQNNTCKDNLENGIFFHFSIWNTASKNQLISNGHHGIYLVSASDSSVYDNLCISNSWTGIYGFYASSASIENNLCVGSALYGISLYNSPYSTILNNTCLSISNQGIFLRASDETDIALNNVTNNGASGIEVQISRYIHIYNNSCYNNKYGISVWGTDRIIIEANYMINNSLNGIQIYDSSKCILTYNRLENNTEYGVYLFDSSSCTIHHNNFVNNNESTSQAYDSGGLSNTWYDIYTDEGNYWSDHLGSGSYFIDGDSSSFDPYPLESQSIPQLNEFRIILIIPFIVLSAIVILLVRKKKKTY